MLDNNVHILGKDNYVDPSATNVSITGNNNSVQGKISNVTIVGNGITITESDTIWIDGVFRKDNSKGRGTDVVRKTAHFNVDIAVKQYLVDTSAGDVNIDMESIFVNSEIYPGYQIYVKKLTQANKITFSSGNNITIDDVSTVSIKNKDTNLQLWYEGHGRMYIV